MSTAIDCMGKLISYQYFVDPPRPVAAPDSIVPAVRADAPTQPLMHRVVDTITKAFEGDVTDARVQLQIVKALLTTVLNDGDERVMVHGPALLKCVRGVYNISLLGKAEGGIQAMGQGMLMQMVNTVFKRVTVRHRASSNFNIDKEGVDDSAKGNENKPQQITLYPTLYSHLNCLGILSRRESVQKIYEEQKPIQLTARIHSMSSLSMLWMLFSFSVLSVSLHQKTYLQKGKSQAIPTLIRSAADLRSVPMRSKVLCLSIIHSVLRDFIPVFTSPSVVVRFSRESVDFMQATKNSICLALATNAPKPMNQVFEISCEIFAVMVTHMRGALKSEIEVFFREIYLPILEMKVSSVDRKYRVVTNLLGPMSRDARILVEMYLNYDCSGSLMSNIYER